MQSIWKSLKQTRDRNKNNTSKYNSLQKKDGMLTPTHQVNMERWEEWVKGNFKKEESELTPNTMHIGDQCWDTPHLTNFYDNNT